MVYYNICMNRENFYGEVRGQAGEQQGAEWPLPVGVQQQVQDDCQVGHGDVA